MSGNESVDVEKFVETATDEQKEVLFTIYDLSQKEKELDKKLEAIRRAPSRGGLYHSGVGVSVCEDLDDVAVISMGPLQEVKQIRGEMGTLMRRAVTELDMGKVGYIQRHYESYVGEPIPEQYQ